MRRLGTCVASAVSLLHSGSAGAESQVQPFRVETRAPHSCAAAQTFEWQLVARTRLLRPARGQEPGLLFTLEVHETGAGVQGRLTLREPDGRAAERELEGTNCPELVSALALVGAILVDPNASTVAMPPTPPAESSAPSSPPAPSPAAVTAPPSETRAPSRTWSYDLGAGPTLQTAAAPDPLFGVMLRADVLPPANQLDPMLFLSLHFAQSPTLHAKAGDARLAWASARIGACPLRWPSAAPVGLRPCLAFEGGVLRGKGSETIKADSPTAPWLALDALVDWELVIGRTVTLGANGGGTLPLVRSRFFFAGVPKENVFHVPAIGLVADVHLGIRFP